LFNIDAADCEVVALLLEEEEVEEKVEGFEEVDWV
jgi:hypothetical protein